MIRSLRLALLVLLLAVSAREALAVDILYTGCSNGRIENCRCPRDPLGALEKRTAEIERRRALGPILLLDSGDFLPATVDTLADPIIIDIYALTGYDAVTLGDQELMQGPKELRLMERKLPLVSANVVWKDGTPVAPPLKVIQRGGQTFAVTGVTPPSALKFVDPSLVGYIRLLDPDSSLSAAIARAPKDAKVIVLSHYGMELDRKNADTWKHVDLIVGGHSQTLIKDGIWGGGRIPVVQAGGGGRYLGVARFHGPRVRAEIVPIRPELPDDPRVIELLMKLKAERRKLKTAP